MTLSFSHLPRISFDGHFGVHRKLHKDFDTPRKVALRGRPSKKHYHKKQRTCTCANKEKDRTVLKNRTAGWQLVIDPHSRHVFAASEHIVNESTKDKVKVIIGAMKIE